MVNLVDAVNGLDSIVSQVISLLCFGFGCFGCHCVAKCVIATSLSGEGIPVAGDSSTGHNRQDI